MDEILVYFTTVQRVYSHKFSWKIKSNTVLYSDSFSQYFNQFQRIRPKRYKKEHNWKFQL